MSTAGTAPALVLQHGEIGPPGLLADWAHERGIELDIHRSERGDPYPEHEGRSFIASLGSWRSPAEVEVPEVAAELDFIARAVDAEVPVLGLCYGAQILAVVLGGEVGPARRPELGWCRIDSLRPDLVPDGPWLQWHYDGFTVPTGGELLASSAAGAQAFLHGSHLGVQFHPESTIEIVRLWARAETARLAELGIEDGEALLESGRSYAQKAAAGSI